MDSFPQTLSMCFVDPPDYIVLCSSILDSSLAMNEDQVVNGFFTMQPTCVIIHDECVWESKEELVVKDDSLPAVPHPLYPDIPCDSSTVDFPMETHFQFFLLPIVHGTRWMSVCHYIAERTHLPSKIFPIYHLSFFKAQRVNILDSHLPLCTIHQIMRIPTNILDFMILVFMISLLLHLIMMLIH